MIPTRIVKKPLYGKARGRLCPVADRLAYRLTYGDQAPVFRPPIVSRFYQATPVLYPEDFVPSTARERR